MRAAAIGDWPRMKEIFAAAGQAAWQHILPAEHLASLSAADRWRDAILDPGQRVLVVSNEESVMAFTVLRASGDPDASQETGEVDSLYSHPDGWGRGYGRRLLAEAEAELGRMGFRSATLWTAELNHRPRRIYESSGWQLEDMIRERTLGGRSFVELRYRKVVH